jgi:uncharacterized protein YndB with AHSA1/START domain
MERIVDLSAPIEDVWEALTRAERVSEWFGAAAVDLDLHPGGRVTFERDGTRLRGLVEAIDPPRAFSFRWLPSGDAPAGRRTRVEFRLEATDGGTRLTVRETPLWELGERPHPAEAGASR